MKNLTIIEIGEISGGSEHFCNIYKLDSSDKAKRIAVAQIDYAVYTNEAACEYMPSFKQKNGTSIVFTTAGGMLSKGTTASVMYFVECSNCGSSKRIDEL